MFSLNVYENFIFDKNGFLSALSFIFPLKRECYTWHMETFLGFVWFVALFGFCFLVVHAAIWLAKRK